MVDKLFSKQPLIIVKLYLSILGFLFFKLVFGIMLVPMMA